MQIVIEIPEEQIKKSLEESKYMHEDEGEKGFVDIMMLYTDGHIDFVDVSRKTDFYSCKYKILPKGHGRLIDADELIQYIDEMPSELTTDGRRMIRRVRLTEYIQDTIPTIIEADKGDRE